AEHARRPSKGTLTLAKLRRLTNRPSSTKRRWSNKTNYSK
ncbi:unnamed protein product, partial [Prunus brigantina]